MVVEAQFLHAEGDIDIELLDSDGNSLASSTSVSDNEVIDTVTPTSGTHYIAVYYGDAGNAYDLRWDDLESGSEDDHANTPAEATPVPALVVVDAELGHAGDLDYFRIELTEPAVLVMETSGSTDTYGTLYSAGSYLDENDDGGAGYNFRLEQERLPAGVYFLEVRGYSQFDQGSYRLSIRSASLSRFGVQEITKHADAPATINLLAEPGRTYGLQRSTDLIRWESVATGLGGDTSASWVDPESRHLGKAFYRASFD